MHRKSPPTLHLRWCSHTSMVFWLLHFRIDHLSPRHSSHWAVSRINARVRSANGTRGLCTRLACFLWKWRSRLFGLRSKCFESCLLAFLFLFSVNISGCKEAFAGGVLSTTGVLP